VPKTAILHQAQTTKEQDPECGVTLWVKRDAKVIYRMAPAQQAAQQALAYYFAGAIQAAAQGGVAGAQARPPVTVGMCGKTPDCTLRCATEITPCINTHAVTCYCPVTHGCPTQGPFCQTQGDCTYIGCGHSLACTFGLLCDAAAAPQALTVAQPCPQTQAAGCHPTQRTPCPVVSCGIDCSPQCTVAPPCETRATNCFPTCGPVTCAPQLCTQRTPCPGVSCGIDCTLEPPCPTHAATCAVTCHATCGAACTHVAPCPTHVATCPPFATCGPACPTHPPHVTCAPVCTHVTPCVTRGQPDCPFPSEIPAQCTHIPNCPHPQAAAMAGGAGTPVYTGPACGPSVVLACTPACLTRYVSCHTCALECWITPGVSFPQCRVSLVYTCAQTCNTPAPGGPC
jgi:hypothetical protein